AVHEDDRGLRVRRFGVEAEELVRGILAARLLQIDGIADDDGGNDLVGPALLAGIVLGVGRRRMREQQREKQRGERCGWDVHRGSCCKSGLWAVMMRQSGAQAKRRPVQLTLMPAAFTILPFSSISDFT